MSMFCSATNTDSKNVWPASFALRPARRTALYIEAAENTEQTRISGGERYAKAYSIDYNRCIFCGFCVEACPTDAITHGHGFEVASYNTSTLVKRKEDMLVPIPAGFKPPVIAPAESSGH